MRWTAWRSTPASSCTTSGPTRPCCGCSASSASRPRSPRCRCRSATTRPASSGPARSARRGLFPTARNLARPAYLRMLAEIPRFHRRARCGWLSEAPSDPVSRPTPSDATLREFLADGGFSPYFQRHFMEPLVAAVWSCDPDVALDYPARYLFAFLDHHGMLGVFGSPHVAHRHRRLARVRRPGRAATLHEVRTGTKVTSVLETAVRGRGDRRQRRGRDVRRRRGRHPSRPGAGDAGRADRASSARCWARSRTRATPRCCTPTPRCCRGARRARASWNFRAPGRRTDGRGHGHLRPDPAAAAADRHPLPGHPRRRATSSTPRP